MAKLPKINNYGARIKKIRENKGIKACFIAEKMGLTPAGYGGIESGRTKLSAENAEKISEILCIDIKEIFFDNKLSVSFNGVPDSEAV